MARDPKNRPRRIPLTSEEVSNFIAYRKKREQIDLQKLKRTRVFKLLNIFNIVCIFIYLEILFCYFGHCDYQKHYSANTIANFGDRFQKNGKPVTADIDVVGVNGRIYKFIVEDFIETPPKRVRFIIGKDYLLRKDLKGSIEGLDGSYRLFSASPILFLSSFISIICFMGFVYNLNENAYSLSGLTTLNALTMFGILIM
jgi:hypothetical protein